MSQKPNLHLRRCFTAVLAVLLLLGTLSPALALDQGDTLGRYAVTVSERHTVAPGVTETEVALNTQSGQEQSCGYVLEVNPADPSASLKVQYKDGDASHWGLRQAAFQAEKAEAKLRQTDANATVVGLINASYYDMSNGVPCGILVMDGVKYHGTDTMWTYLAIFRDGTARILPGGTTPPADVVDAIAGKEMLLQNGKIVAPADKTSEPRTAIGVKADGTVVLFAVDGRQPPQSMGMKFSELAAVMRDLGCVDAANFDGGGSTVFMTRRAGDTALLRRNSPSGGLDRPVASTLLVVSTAAAQGGTDPAASEAHTWVYTAGSSTLKCSDCNETRAVSGYTGFAAISGTTDRTCFIAGKQQTGWFAWGDSMRHADENGVLHRTETNAGRSCTSGGKLTAVCERCGEKYESELNRQRTGHIWNEKHICTVCGKQGKNIASAVISGLSECYAYQEGENIKPIPVVTDGSNTLRASASTSARDAHLSWEDFWHIGTARVVAHGQGDYYGLVEKTYRIVPGEVPNVSFDNVTASSVDLHWDAVDGAEQYAVFVRNGDELTEIAATKGTETSIRVSGLKKQTTYTMCVKARATVDGEQYDSESWTWIYPRTLGATDTDAFVKGIAAQVGAQAIQLQIVDGKGHLFLPACADLKALPLTFTVQGGEGKLTLEGDLGAMTLNGTEGTVNLPALCTRSSDGTYPLQVALGTSAPMTIYVMRASVPALFLTSDDPVNQGRSFVEKSKDNKTTGAAVLLSTTGETVYSGALTQIKARGNTTFVNAAKKSYQIKLDKKTDLIQIGEKGKTWVLLAGYADATQMHDKLLKDLAASIGMAYTPKENWVDLYYDGEYRGVYLLGEKNSIGSTSVDITDMEAAYEGLNEGYGDNAVLQTGENRFGQDFRYTEGLTEPENITGGYLLELNNTQYDEASGFHTRQTIDRSGKQEHVALNVKSPEWAGRDAMAYISEYYQEFEDAVYAQDENGNYTGVNPETGKRFDEYADLQSLVQMYLVQELSGNVDCFYSSLYFYKDADSILYAGPVWDLDSTFGSGWTGVITPDNQFLSDRYLAKALIRIPAFKQAVDQYYADTFRPEAVKLPDQVTAHRAAISDSTGMNYKLWPLLRIGNPNKDGHLWPDGTTWGDTLRDLKEWIVQRIAMMDKAHNCDAAAPILPPDQTDEPAASPTPTAEPTTKPADVTLPYTDVAKTSYYYDAVAWAHTHGITDGTSATTFSPGSTCTRGQIVTFLWRTVGCPEPKSMKHGFKDVKAGSYYEKAVAWALEEGITDGTSETTFSPNASCLRAHAVTFLFRLTKAAPVSGGSPFKDVPVKAYYYNPVTWAYRNEVVNGMTETTFGPDVKCQRDHIVTILYRYFG